MVCVTLTLKVSSTHFSLRLFLIFDRLDDLLHRSWTCTIVDLSLIDQSFLCSLLGKDVGMGSLYARFLGRSTLQSSWLHRFYVVLVLSWPQTRSASNLSSRQLFIVSALRSNVFSYLHVLHSENLLRYSTWRESSHSEGIGPWHSWGKLNFWKLSHALQTPPRILGTAWSPWSIGLGFSSKPQRLSSLCSLAQV